MSSSKKISNAKSLMKLFFDEEDFTEPTAKQKNYGVGFAVRNNFYKEDYVGKTEILYSISRDNFVDFGEHLYISTSDLWKCHTPADIYKAAKYADWTDKEHSGEITVPEYPNKELRLPQKTAAEIDSFINKEWNKSQIEKKDNSIDKLCKELEEAQ